MKEFLILNKIFKTSKKERLVEATAIVLGHLAEDNAYRDQMSSVMQTILKKLKMEQTYAWCMHANLLFVLRMLCDNEDLACELYASG
eukprot:4463864-Pyramimonas_sp.AAC.1